MLINLYIVRVVLRALGQEDFGTYNAVAGVILLFTSVSGVLSTAIQRFYSFSLGKKDSVSLRGIYSSSIVIISLFILVFFVVGETIGVWFVNSHLGVPPERLYAVNWLFQFSIFTFLTSLLVIPFSAAVIANERMGFFALISVLDCVLRLAVAGIVSIVSADRLIAYGGLLLVVSVLGTTAYVIYCKRSFAECRFERPKDKQKYRDILSFSGWNLFGTVANVLNHQGNTILVNIFFGPVVTASRAIALHISSALNTFCNSVVMALRPPMTKSYAEGNTDYLMRMFYFSSKFILYSMLLVCIPLFFEMPFLLKIWLGEVSPDMVSFSRIVIVYALVYSLHYPITTIVQASGHVKRYFTVVDGFTLLSMPVTFLFFKLGFAAYTTFVIMTIVFAIAQVLRLLILKKLVNDFSFSVYFFHFLLPAICIAFASFGLVWLVHLSLSSPFLRLVVVLLLSIVVISLSSYCCGLTKNERAMVKRMIAKKFKRTDDSRK